jgi:hypothetical protein
LADHYCPYCGVGHGGESEQEAAPIVVEDNTVTPAEVEIARINADKEIRLAKIAAGVLDQERDEDLARAEGRAEGMAEAIDTLTPDPDPVPVMVDSPAPEPEAEPDVAPPPPVSDVPASAEPTKPKRSAHGMSRSWFG